MGSSINKVQAGEALHIPASTYNAFADAAMAHRRGQKSTPPGRTGASDWPSCVVPIENNSGSDCDRYDILGISGTLFSPSDADAFKNNPALTGVAPAAADHTGKFAICLTPIASGAIGSALVAGMAPVQINVTDVSHKYAEITEGQGGYLTSAAAGSAQILWVESGTGTKWGLVRLGGGAAITGGSLEWGRTLGFTSGTEITLDPCDSAGADNGLPDVSARMAADGTEVTMDIAFAAIVSFVRDPLTGDCQVVGLPNDTLAGVFPDNGLTGTVDLVTDVTYDTSSKKLEQWKITLTFEKGVLTEASDPPVASTVDTASECV